jgi:EmrB/QacA subfamily drug resistance transporter
VACAAANDIVFLNSARAVQGIGGAIMFAVSLALLANAFPEAKARAGALAAYGATIGASFAFGPLVGGAITSGLGWRWIFLINVPLGLTCLAITRAYVAESRDTFARRVDVPGLLTLTGGLFLLVLALLRGNEQGWGSAAIVAELAGAVVLIAAFVAIEYRSREPMLPLGLFRNPSFTGAQVAAFSISASLFAIFLYLTIYLQQVLGLSPIEAGLVYMPGTLANFVVAGYTSQLGERISPRAMISIGLTLVSIGMALGLVATAESSWVALMPSFVIAMVGTGMFNPAVSAVALGSAPARQSGLAAGVNDTFRQAGIAVGVAALGALIPAGDAFGGSADAYVSGMHDAMIAGAALAAVGAVASWRLIRGPEHEGAVAGQLAAEAA